MSKKKVRDEVYCDLVGCTTLSEMQALLTKLITQYGEDACVDFDAGYNNIDCTVQFLREETDEEYRKRVKSEAREKEEKRTLAERKAKKEMGEYLRLKQKFEGAS